MNPLVIMALLSAASMGANVAGQRKVDKQRAAAMREQRAKRAATETETSKKAQDTLALLTSAAKDEGASAASLKQELVGAQEPLGPQGQAIDPTLLDVVAPTGSNRTIEEEGRQRLKQRAYTSSLAGERAKLLAFGDVMSGRQIGAARNEQDIGRANTSLRNWSQFVLPAQLEAANASGKNLFTLGDILSAAAAIYSPIGLAGTGAKAASTAATAASAAQSSGILGRWYRPGVTSPGIRNWY